MTSGQRRGRQEYRTMELTNGFMHRLHADFSRRIK